MVESGGDRVGRVEAVDDVVVVVVDGVDGVAASQVVAVVLLFNHMSLLVFHASK